MLSGFLVVWRLLDLPALTSFHTKASVHLVLVSSFFFFLSLSLPIRSNASSPLPPKTVPRSGKPEPRAALGQSQACSYHPILWVIAIPHLHIVSSSEANTHAHTHARIIILLFFFCSCLDPALHLTLQVGQLLLLRFFRCYSHSLIEFHLFFSLHALDSASSLVPLTRLDPSLAHLALPTLFLNTIQTQYTGL